MWCPGFCRYTRYLFCLYSYPLRAPRSGKWSNSSSPYSSSINGFPFKAFSRRRPNDFWPQKYPNFTPGESDDVARMKKLFRGLSPVSPFLEAACAFLRQPATEKYQKDNKYSLIISHKSFCLFQFAKGSSRMTLEKSKTFLNTVPIRFFMVLLRFFLEPLGSLQEETR